LQQVVQHVKAPVESVQRIKGRNSSPHPPSRDTRTGRPSPDDDGAAGSPAPFNAGM
jgi:hypothetical protein